MKSISLVYEQDRREITKYLKALSLEGLGVEIGVCKALFSKHLLENWDCDKLYLIDPWDESQEYDEKHHDHKTNYQQALNNLKGQEGRYEILRCLSHEAIGNFKDNSLDFVYIDGNHSYEGVRADLSNYYPKLKYGGVMMGDDYHRLPEEDMVFGGKKIGRFGVKLAVDEFCLHKKINISLNYHGDWAYAVDGDYRVLSRNWLFIK